jgi:hypothetical protein
MGIPSGNLLVNSRTPLGARHSGQRVSKNRTRDSATEPQPLTSKPPPNSTSDTNNGTRDSATQSGKLTKNHQTRHSSTGSTPTPKVGRSKPYRPKRWPESSADQPQKKVKLEKDLPNLSDSRRIHGYDKFEDIVAEEDGYSDSDDDELPPLLPRTTAAEKRNGERIREAIARDKETIKGKYLESNVANFLPHPLQGPDDTFQPPDQMLANIKAVADSPVKTPKPSKVHFRLSPDALDENSRILELHDFDLALLMDSEKDSTLDYGSEFRPLDQLELVIGNHPGFPELKNILSQGMSYRFSEELSDDERVAELNAILQRGNHKSTCNNEAEAKALLAKDVTHGFSMPVLPGVVTKIKGAMAQPLGLAVQTTLDEAGKRVLKYRLTQDLSFSITSDTAAINQRIDMDAYPEMIYGWCLLRILHFIAALRFAFPNKRILIGKYDYSDAYRRMCHSASAAAQSIAVLGGIAYIALRLTFGGSPNPPTWCNFSEMVADASNELLMSTEWDPRTLRSPAQPVTPEPKLEPADVPIGLAKMPAVVVPTSTTSKTDGYIDDLMNVFLDTPDNRERSPHAVPLVMHVTSRPHTGEKEPLPRRAILSAPKLLHEGTPAEIQIVLGWLLDTRRFLVALPHDKFVMWTDSLMAVADQTTITFQDLETLIGRLNHAAAIIPLSRHFLNRLRGRLLCRTSAAQQITLSPEELEDVLLWEEFLAIAHSGISINKIITRQPDFLIWSDSCPYGIGGYHISGRAWRIRIPGTSPLFGEPTINNYLEFLGMLINIWLVCLEQPTAQLCILALGDSTSAIGWIFKSGRIDKKSVSYDVVQHAARKLASLVMQSTHCLATQHIKGEENIVSDLLSFSATRDKVNPLAADDPPDDVLTNRFHAHLSSQIPESFNISHLPGEILSWVTLQLQALESSVIRNC